MNFFENYKSRLTRINDRENSIFLRALLERINNAATFQSLAKLTSQQKVDMIETLLNNASIFSRGSPQFHVPLELHDKYFSSFENKEQIHSIIEMFKQPSIASKQ